MIEKRTVEDWLDTAVSGIRFGPDRKAVRAELEGHMEDKMAGLRRVFPDIPEDEARDRALAGMGDAWALKKELAKVHRPWLGYLWRASQALAAVTLALVLFLYGGRAAENYHPPQTDGQPPYSDYVEKCYQSGIDPFRADGPYPAKGGDVIRTPLAALRPEGSAQAGGYRFRVKQAGLFRFQDNPEDLGKWWLFCQLRAMGPPWAPVSQNALWHLRAVDSSGREYASSYEVYDLRQEHVGYVMTNLCSGSWPEARIDLTIFDIPPGTEWIRLEYDRLGVQWSLTIPLTAEGGGRNG